MAQPTLDYQFASDNYAPAHASVIKKISNVNNGFVSPYGYDAYTQDAAQLLKTQFGPNSEAYFVGNGTTANVLGLKAILQSFHGVICTDCAHINTDECGAFESIVGGKLLTAPASLGKLTPAHIHEKMAGRGDEHCIQPKAISLTQATELGTVYNMQELQSLVACARKYGLYVQMDGARIANAAAHLNVSLAAMTTDLGIDIISVGGTKNGMMMGEAVVFANQKLAEHFKLIRKKYFGLFSKQRYIAAQFIAFFEDGLWLKNAQHANAMAQLFVEQIANIPEVSCAYPTQANELFIQMPLTLRNALLKKYFFYTWQENSASHSCVVRLVTSFATKPESVEALVKEIKNLLPILRP